MILRCFSVLKLLHHAALLASRKPTHHLVPHGRLHRTAVLEQFATTWSSAPVCQKSEVTPCRSAPAAHLQRIPNFFAPAMRAQSHVLLMALTSQPLQLFLHHQLHQYQSGLPPQVADVLLQQTDDLGQW